MRYLKYGKVMSWDVPICNILAICREVLIKSSASSIDRVSFPSPIAIDMLMVRNGKGQSSHVPVFCVNFERHICTHITTSIKCYLYSLRYVYVPFTNISCQSNWHVYI